MFLTLPLMFCVHMACAVADRVELTPSTHHAVWWVDNTPATYPYDFVVFNTGTMIVRIDYDPIFKSGME